MINTIATEGTGINKLIDILLHQKKAPKSVDTKKLKAEAKALLRLSFEEQIHKMVNSISSPEDLAKLFKPNDLNQKEV